MGDAVPVDEDEEDVDDQPGENDGMNTVNCSMSFVSHNLLKQYL